jgi:glycosyltransferase involved in cell wall biosynthesis
MIRVGIDAATWYNDRGFGRFTRGLVEALAKRSSEFSYTLVLDRDPDRDFPVDVLVERSRRPITEAAVGAGHRSLQDMLALSRAVGKANFDLFFFPAVYSFFPLAPGSRCAVCFHDAIAERHPGLTLPTKRSALFWSAKTRLAKLQATRVMTVSRASAWDLSLMLGIAQERIDVLTAAADPIFRVYDVPKASPPELLYVGGLNPHKNLLGLLRALPAIAAKRPEVRIAIAGDLGGRGFHDEVGALTRAVEATSIAKSRVRFLGRLEDEALVRLMNGATALVLPSLLEGFGLPAVEGMACGLPVVASRRGSLPEVIGDAGLFFDPLSPDDIARAILRLIEDPALQADLRKKALARAAQFTWDRAAELAEASFRKCL